MKGADQGGEKEGKRHAHGLPLPFRIISITSSGRQHIRDLVEVMKQTKQERPRKKTRRARHQGGVPEE